MLLMRKCFFDDIRAGTKTTTLRYWRCCRVRAGSLHTIPGLGKVRIESVQTIGPGDLGERDASADGFGTLRALKRTLHRLYSPGARAGRKLYKVCFTYLPDGE